MDGRKLTKLVSVVMGALALILIVALTQAAPPRPHPRPRPGVHPRPSVRRPRVLVRQRHPLVVRRYGPRVVVDHRGKIIRKAPTPVVITAASDLKVVPVADLSQTTSHKIVRVSDSGMPMVNIGGQETPIRLIGVDPAVPENAGDDDSKKAAEFFRNLVVGEYVYLEYDAALSEKDEDGNRVGYLYRAPDKMLVNLELIRQGYALAATDYDYREKELFAFYESKAAIDGKGIWVSAAPAETPEATSTDETETGQ